MPDNIYDPGDDRQCAECKHLRDGYCHHWMTAQPENMAACLDYKPTE